MRKTKEKLFYRKHIILRPGKNKIIDEKHRTVYLYNIYYYIILDRFFFLTVILLYLQQSFC